MGHIVVLGLTDILTTRVGIEVDQDETELIFIEVRMDTPTQMS